MYCCSRICNKNLFLKDSVFSSEAEANVLLVQVSSGELLFIFKRQNLAFKSSSTYLKWCLLKKKTVIAPFFFVPSFFSLCSKTPCSPFYQMALCLLVVYWHFQSDLSDLPFWCFLSVAVSPPHYNCLLSLTPLWSWCCLFCFYELHTFLLLSHILYDILSHAPSYLFCSSLFLLACQVLFCELVSPFPFVSSRRPFCFGCFCLQVFSFLSCLDPWPCRTSFLALTCTAWLSVSPNLNALYPWLHNRTWSMWGPFIPGQALLFPQCVSGLFKLLFLTMFRLGFYHQPSHQAIMLRVNI